MPEVKTELDGDDPFDRPFTAKELSRFRRVPVSKQLRWRFRLTQEEFSTRFGIPLGTLRDWEQGRTEPDATAKAYLKVIAAEPALVARIVGTEAA
jgi:putative transcriptional regulator